MSPAESTLEHTRASFRQLVAEAGLNDAAVTVRATPLSPEQAIGTPTRKDFPILVGKERVVEAEIRGAKGHAFTDAPRPFRGTLREVTELSLHTNAERAIYVASLNATLRKLGRAQGTVHCKDDDPERCAPEIAAALQREFESLHSERADPLPAPRVGLVGLNPALAEGLVRAFGAAQVRIVDLNPDNIGTTRFGVMIGDGSQDMDGLVDFADIVLLTGTTLVNATFDDIWRRVQQRGKRGIVFGVTAAGVAALEGLPRLCPCGRDE